ncbi:GGDEF domain-containing protein [Mycoplasmatota bacterium zrk1]
MEILIKIDTNILSVLIVLILLYCNHILRDSRNKKNNYFFFLMIITIIMLMLEIIVWILVDNTSDYANILLRITYFIFIALTPIGPSIWRLYVINHINIKKITKKTLLLSFFPTLIHLIILIVSQWTDYLYIITTQNEIITGIGSIWTSIAAIIPIICAFYLTVKNRLLIHSNAFKALLFFGIIPVIASLIELITIELFLLWPTIAVSLLLLFLFIEISRLSLDYLTGTYNRKQLHNYMENLIKHKENFTILMYDFDNLKLINDTYGHVSGDEALVYATNIIKNNINRSFYFARYAGDEFILINRDSKETAEEVSKKIDEAFITHNDKRVTEFDIFMSSGTLYCEGQYNSVTELIREVDELMYNNKHNNKRDRTNRS